MKKTIFCGMVILAAMIAFIPGAKAAEYTLSDLYQQALKNSEKIKLAEENLYIAKTSKDKAWAVLIPRLTAFGTYNHFSEQKVSSGAGVIQPYESGNWGVRADESFTLNGRELNALKVAGQSIIRSEYDLDATKSDFVLAVASAYFDVMKSKKSTPK